MRKIKKSSAIAMFVSMTVCLSTFVLAVEAGNNSIETFAYAEEEPILFTTEPPLPTQPTVFAEPWCFIEIASPPAKTEYQIGEELDLSGLTVDLNYARGGEIPESELNKYDTLMDDVNPLEAPETFIVDTSGFDADKAGEYKITISLTREVTDKLYYCYCSGVSITVTVSENSVKGDVNDDGEFNVADVVALQKWLLAVPDVELKNWKAADLCEDDKLDVFDLCLMKHELINSGIVENPLLTIEQEYYFPGENGYETVHETKNLYESNIEDVDDLKAIKNFAANASDYKDCEMTEMGLDIADYGFDTLKAYYTDENGIRQELILCEFGGMCRWLDNKKVQNFVEMLIEKEYFADKDIFEWFKDNYHTNEKMPYITDQTGGVTLSEREKIWETLAYRYPDTDLSDFRLVYTPEHPLEKYLKHDVFSVYYKGILCHGYGNLNTASNVYVINIASNFVCPIEKYSEVDVNTKCIPVDNLSEYVELHFDKSDVTKIIYIRDKDKSPVLAYRIVIESSDCEYIIDAVTGEKIDWIPYTVP